MSAGHFHEEPLSGGKAVRWFHATAERLQPGDSTLLNVHDQGYQYGEGVFETLRAVNRRPVLLDRHMRRLAESARFLEIPLPTDLSAIPAAIDRILPREDSIIKMTLSRGGSGRYAESNSHAALSLQISPYFPPDERLYGQGVVLATASAQRSATSPLHRHKTLNYLESITARREASARGAYEALIVNTDDLIAECSMSSIFFVLDGEVLTPSIESNILPGITREAVLNLCEADGIRRDARLMNFADVLFAQEVFITNSLIGVMPVREIDGKIFGKSCPGPVTARLSELYRKEILGL
jgi:aminodeoxychorismate lyase